MHEFVFFNIYAVVVTFGNMLSFFSKLFQLHSIGKWILSNRRENIIIVEYLEVGNIEETNVHRNYRQRTSEQTSHFETQKRQEINPQSSDRHNHPFNGNIKLNLENENSISIDCVPETPQHGNQFQMNENV